MDANLTGSGRCRRDRHLQPRAPVRALLCSSSRPQIGPGIRPSCSGLNRQRAHVGPEHVVLELNSTLHASGDVWQIEDEMAIVVARGFGVQVVRSFSRGGGTCVGRWRAARTAGPWSIRASCIRYDHPIACPRAALEGFARSCTTCDAALWGTATELACWTVSASVRTGCRLVLTD